MAQGGPRRRIAVIGAGMAIPPHAQSLLDLADRVEVACVFTRSSARRDAVTQKFKLPTTDALDPLFADKTIEALLVLSPPTTHLALVERAAAAGKHVLLEKPIEVTVERATRLVEAAERGGIALGLVLQHRFRPNALRPEALIRDGALGTVAAASVSGRRRPPPTHYDQPRPGTQAPDRGGLPPP